MRLSSAPSRPRATFFSLRSVRTHARSCAGLRNLLRHTNRSADDAAIIDRALTLLVEQLAKVKYGRTDRPRPDGTFDSSSRHVPAHLRRAVSARDGDRCAFVGSEGRCTETAGLQYHHRIPFADGGPTTVDNLELRCPAHNAYEAERWFGPLFVRETGGAWACPPKRPARRCGPAHRSAQREGMGPAPPKRVARRWGLPTEAPSAKVGELGLDQDTLVRKARGRLAVPYPMRPRICPISSAENARKV